MKVKGNPERRQEDLFRKAQNGDLKAFGMLIKPHEQMIWSICWHFTRNRKEAEACGLEVMRRAWRNRAGCGSSETLREWIYVIAVACGMEWPQKEDA